MAKGNNIRASEVLRYEKIMPRMEKGEEVKGHDFDEDSEYGVHVEVFHEIDSHLEDNSEPIMDEL